MLVGPLWMEKHRFIRDRTDGNVQIFWTNPNASPCSLQIKSAQEVSTLMASSVISLNVAAATASPVWYGHVSLLFGSL